MEFSSIQDAVNQGISPIVVDRGNGLNLETRQYAAYAVEYGYVVELTEPDSPWWQELRVLLKYKSIFATNFSTIGRRKTLFTNERWASSSIWHDRKMDAALAP